MAQLEAQQPVPETPGQMPYPVTLTTEAAEMVQRAMKEEGLEGQGLRVGVVGGGCSGLQYLLDFAEGPAEDDLVAEQHGVRLFVDPYSAGHLAGTTLEFVDGPEGAGFKFENPNMIKACGCGSAS